MQIDESGFLKMTEKLSAKDERVTEKLILESCSCRRYVVLLPKLQHYERVLAGIENRKNDF